MNVVSAQTSFSTARGGLVQRFPKATKLAAHAISRFKLVATDGVTEVSTSFFSKCKQKTRAADTMAATNVSMSGALVITRDVLISAVYRNVETVEREGKCDEE
jgi:hypothetical protein